MGRRVLFMLAVASAVLAATVAPAAAITFGEFDDGLHPNTGALVAEFQTDEGPVIDLLCSGVLIAPDVFLTASHCTAFLEALEIPASRVWVTFDPRFNLDPGLGAVSTLLDVDHWVTHEEFGRPGGGQDPHDIAVVILDQAVTGVDPAELPEAGLLDEMKADSSLRSQLFTAVGYGVVREDKRRGPHAFFFDGTRRYAPQGFLHLNKVWLTLSMNPSTGNAGTCYGDSGGPHFLGGVESNVVVSITVTGDAMCRATDVTYRLDTEAARDFLDDFVPLP